MYNRPFVSDALWKILIFPKILVRSIRSFDVIVSIYLPVCGWLLYCCANFYVRLRTNYTFRICTNIVKGQHPCHIVSHHKKDFSCHFDLRNFEWCNFEWFIILSSSNSRLLFLASTTRQSWKQVEDVHGVSISNKLADNLAFVPLVLVTFKVE